MAYNAIENKPFSVKTSLKKATLGHQSSFQVVIGRIQYPKFMKSFGFCIWVYTLYNLGLTHLLIQGLTYPKTQFFDPQTITTFEQKKLYVNNELNNSVRLIVIYGDGFRLIQTKPNKLRVQMIQIILASLNRLNPFVLCFLV